MNHILERTWAEIDLDNIEHNYKTIKARIGDGTRFLGVVKANAYGHGALQTAQLLQELECECLGVATLGEAVRLRRNGITMPILILGYTDPCFTGEIMDYDLTQAIITYDMASKMSEAALSAGGKLRVHLKIDTGMGRLGFSCLRSEEPADELLEIMKLEGLDIEGIFTHFAVSELPNNNYTRDQLRAFTSLVEKLEGSSWIKFKIKHCANSGAMINYNETWLDMVRCGISLYGLYPGADTSRISLRPAMSIRTRIVQIKDVPADCSISYGRKYRTREPRRIAVLPIGYADGLHRNLSGKIDFLIDGKRAPQIGNICMDMCMADITDVPGAAAGMAATLFGVDKGYRIYADEIAAAAGTISYEILCSFSERVPRVYLRGGVML